MEMVFVQVVVCTVFTGVSSFIQQRFFSSASSAGLQGDRCVTQAELLNGPAGCRVDGLRRTTLRRQHLVGPVHLER